MDNDVLSPAWEEGVFFYSMRISRLAMVQFNPIVGDLSGNIRAIIQWIKEAKKSRADVVAFPELAITGYPPEDLVLRPSFLKDTRLALDEVIKHCGGITAVIGFIRDGEKKEPIRPEVFPTTSPSPTALNAAAIVHNRQVVATYAKMILPNYGVFDEQRYFSAGNRPLVFELNGIRYGVNICEDIWKANGPTFDEAGRGRAHIILNINASPYQMGKDKVREGMLARRARENGVVVSYTNMVGGQDEIIFDGQSLVVNASGQIITRGKAFEEELLVTDIDIDAKGMRGPRRKQPEVGGANSHHAVQRVVLSREYLPKRRRLLHPRRAAPLDPLEEVYRALVLGVRDYVNKNRFQKVLVGISGGIDSALTSVIAVDALGPEQVTGVFMPSMFTSKESRQDSLRLMKNLKVPLLEIPITKLWNSYLHALAPVFEGKAHDTTEENLQARIRGNLLMAMSNKFGHLVLTTGNKSEMSVGYATLYGDMAGGFAVIKDLSKTLVYDLAKYRNQRAQSEMGMSLIPQRIIDRPPSAELKPHQTDQDTLPPYEMLDPILEAYVEDDRAFDDIVRMGFPSTMVQRVITMVDRSEYKRRQAPVGIKITERALGKDRRMPVTNRYVKR